MAGPRVLVDADKWSEYDIVSTEGDLAEYRYSGFTQAFHCFDGRRKNVKEKTPGSFSPGINGKVEFEMREFAQTPKLTQWKLKLSYVPFHKSYGKYGNDHERDSDKSFFSQYQMSSNE